MKLYKYLTAPRIDILTRGRIRFTQPIFFNDPFDTFPSISSLVPEEQADGFASGLAQETLNDEQQLNQYYDEELLKLQRLVPFDLRRLIPFDSVLPEMKRIFPIFLRELLSMPGRTQGQFAAMLRERVSQRLGILTLAERPDNLLMWAHYSDSHRGFAIEFDNSHPYFDQRKGPRDRLRVVQKVEYSCERPDIVLYDPKKEDSDHIDQVIAEFFFTKSRDWEYEQEWRMIRPLEEAQEKIESDQGDVFLFDIPPDCVRAVVLGSRMEVNARTMLVNLVSSDKRYGHVAIFQARIDDRHFQVAIDRMKPEKST